MLIGFGMPAVTNVALSGGSSAWAAGHTFADLFGGRPSRAARITRSGTVTLTITLATSIVPGVIALLGLNLAAGTAITAAGASGTARALADGSVACYLLPTGTSPTTTVVITIAGNTLLQVGEIAIMRAVDIPHEPGFIDELIDPTQWERSRGSQIEGSPRVPYRRLAAAFTSDAVSIVRGGGLAGGMDWNRLRYALSGAARCIAIPRLESAAEIHATAIYGRGVISSLAHNLGPWHSAGIEVRRHRHDDDRLPGRLLRSADRTNARGRASSQVEISCIDRG